MQSVPQVDGAHDYLKRVGPSPLDVAALEAACGVGITISPAQIKDAVAAAVEANKAKLLEER